METAVGLERINMMRKMVDTIVDQDVTGPLTLSNGVFLYPQELEILRSRLKYPIITELDLYQEKCKMGGNIL